MPPPSPVTRPRAGSIRTQLLGLVSIVSAASDSEADISRSLLSQVDGLDDVFREEELHRPIHQHTDLPFQPRQLS